MSHSLHWRLDQCHCGVADALRVRLRVFIWKSSCGSSSMYGGGGLCLGESIREGLLLWLNSRWKHDGVGFGFSMLAMLTCWR